MAVAWPRSWASRRRWTSSRAPSARAWGAIGGFAASHHPDMDLLRCASRPYIFTASPSPSAIASVRAALQALRSRPELRERLWSNARQLYRGLAALGYRIGPQPSPIVPVLLGSPEEGVAFWENLIERGVYVNLVPPLATPGGQALVRCSVSAAHTPEQIERIIQAFAALRAPAAKAMAGA
ncbi:aminotransferase class I/II-fold pyridoxal phosphate-dependent enzyme [Azotobacter vinelandii]